MFKLQQVMRYEGLLLMRNKAAIGFLIVFALFWPSAVGYYEVTDVPKPRAGFFYELLFPFYALWVMMLAAGLVGLFMAHKDRSNGFEQLLLVWKVKNSECLAGKWLAVQLYCAVLTVIPLVTLGVWLATGAYDFNGWLQHVVFVFLNVGGAVMFSSSLGFLIGHLLRSRLVYLLVLALWGVMSWIQLEAAGTSTFLNTRLRLLAPYFTEYFYSPYGGVFELHGQFPAVWLQQIAVFLLGLTFLLLLLVWYRRQRQVVSERRYGRLVLGAVFVPALLLAALRLQVYEVKVDEFVRFAQERMTSGDDDGLYFYEPKDRVDTQYTMDRTDLQVKLLGANRIAVQAELTATYHGTKPASQLELSLFGDLKVKSLHAQKHGAVEWKQEVDTITVTLPKPLAAGDSVDLSLQYEGSVFQTDRDAYAEISFAESNRVFLRKGNGWYPLIGKRSLWKAHEHNDRYLNFELREVYLEEPSPTDFSVKIEQDGLTESTIAMSIGQTGANTYAGRTDDLVLAAGHMEERSVEGVRVYAHPDVIVQAEAMVEAKLPGWKYVEQLLGVQRPQTIFVIGDPGIQLFRTHDTPVQFWGMWKLEDSPDRYHFKSDFMVSPPFRNWYMAPHGTHSFHLDLLETSTKWAVRKEFDDTRGETRFAEFYRKTSFYVSQTILTPEEKAVREQAEKWIDQIGNYEEAGKTEYEALIRFLYQQFQLAQTPQEFDMGNALALYEQQNARKER